MKTKKMLAIILTIAMLVGMMSVNAFAADPIKELGPNDNDKVEAAITKDITTGKGDTLDPTIAGFTFQFEIQQNKTATIPDGSPTVNTTYTPATQTLGLNELVTIGPEYVLANYESDNAANDNYRNESANIIPSNYASKVTEEGIFVYDITEVNSDDIATALTEAGWTKNGHVFTRVTEESITEGTQTGTKTTTETFTMSQAAYQLRIYTKLKDGATAGEEGSYYVSAITLVQTKTDTGDDIDNGPKKNPTPGGDQTTYTMSQLEFKNTYTKVVETDLVSPNNQPYEISKRVTGVDQDAIILHGGQKFKFTVTMTLPEGAEKKAYNALYWDSDNGESFTALEDGGAQKKTVFDFTSATGNSVTMEIELEHDQKVTFPGVPAGTVFTTVEDDYYTTGVTGENKDANDELIVYRLKPVINGGAVPAEPVSEAARTDSQTVAANTSKASAYVNDGGEGTTPAGIIMQYLPFVLIIVLAVMALVASAVIKAKRRTVAR